jgi:para-aminobenzoate synthetase component I
MLVDLERNDLGRVCQYGSVQVNEFMVIEKYSHVMHIVSNVKGELAEDKDEYDLIDAVFPGGTITGAPKVRTMEIIEELEPVQRGIYTGSLGWIGFDGDTELNIIIRTMLVKDGKAHVQAGAGIVIDSSPKNEYKESLKKALALWKAKEMAGDVR